MKKTGRKGKGLAAAKYAEFHALKHGDKGYRQRKHLVYRSASGSTFVGRDLLGIYQVPGENAAPGDMQIRVPINPIELALTAEEIEAQLHQQFVVKKLGIHKVKTTGTVVNGTILGFYERDPNALQQEGEKALQEGYYKGGQEAEYKNAHTWELPHFRPPTLYCQNDGSDDRFTEQAIFYLYTVVPPSVYTSTADPGPVNVDVELWINYHIEFRVKSINLAPSLQQCVAALFTDYVAYTPTQEGPTPNYLLAGPLYSEPNSKSLFYIPGLFWGQGLNADMLAGTPQLDAENTCYIGCLKGFGVDRALAFDLMLQFIYNSITIPAADEDKKTPNVDITYTGLQAYYAKSFNVTAATGNLAFETKQGPHAITGLYQHTCFTRIDVEEPGMSYSITAQEAVQYIDSQGNIQTIPAGGVITANWCFAWVGNMAVGDGWPTSHQSQCSFYAVCNLSAIDSSPPLNNFLGPATLEYNVREQCRALRRKGKHIKIKDAIAVAKHRRRGPRKEYDLQPAIETKDIEDCDRPIPLDNKDWEQIQLRNVRLKRFFPTDKKSEVKFAVSPGTSTVGQLIGHYDADPTVTKTATLAVSASSAKSSATLTAEKTHKGIRTNYVIVDEPATPNTKKPSTK